MPVIYKSKGDYVPFVDLYGAGTLDMLKTNLLLKVFQKTKDKYCNFKFGCGWDDETWGVGVYYGTSIVVSTTTNNREFFIVFYPNEASTGLNLLGTAYLLDGRTPVYVRYIERDGTASWHIENVNKNENNICQTVVGSKNYTGHQINSGEYFIANGEKYKATAAIPNGSSWQGSATAVSDHDLINALVTNSIHKVESSGYITTNTSLTYTGKSVVIPAKSYFFLRGYGGFAHAPCNGIALSFNSNPDAAYDFASVYLSGIVNSVSFCGYAGGVTTMYLHTKFQNASSNPVGIVGGYITVG